MELVSDPIDLMDISAVLLCMDPRQTQQFNHARVLSYTRAMKARKKTCALKQESNVGNAQFWHPSLCSHGWYAVSYSPYSSGKHVRTI